MRIDAVRRDPRAQIRAVEVDDDNVQCDGTHRARRSNMSPDRGLMDHLSRQRVTRAGVDAVGRRVFLPRHAWTSPTLDGSIFGEPLVGTTKVIVATENHTVLPLECFRGQDRVGPNPCSALR